MTGYGSIAKTKQDGSWVKYVLSWMPEKKIKLCSASRMTFRAWFYMQNRSPKYWRTIRNTFGLFEKHFSEANEPKKPRNIFQTEKFRTIFEKRTPIYSLAAPFLGLAKSIYYFNYGNICSRIWFWLLPQKFALYWAHQGWKHLIRQVLPFLVVCIFRLLFLPRSFFQKMEIADTPVDSRLSGDNIN